MYFFFFCNAKCLFFVELTRVCNSRTEYAVEYIRRYTLYFYLFQYTVFIFFDIILKFILAYLTALIRFSQTKIDEIHSWRTNRCNRGGYSISGPSAIIYIFTRKRIVEKLLLILYKYIYWQTNYSFKIKTIYHVFIIKLFTCYILSSHHIRIDFLMIRADIKIDKNV